MLLGGRAADLLGRRRVLRRRDIASSGCPRWSAGFAQSAGVLVGARLAQGLGAAMTLPAALSILTTTFKEGTDRNTALGVWGGRRRPRLRCRGAARRRADGGPGLALGDVRQPDRGACWSCAVFRLISGERRRAAARELRPASERSWSPAGCCCSSTRSSRRPIVGWGASRTIGGDRRRGSHYSPRSSSTSSASRTRLPRCRSSASTGSRTPNATQLIAFAGFLGLFFFLTLYMQNVLGYSAIQTGARLPSPHVRHRHGRGHLLPAHPPHRDTTGDRRRSGDRARPAFTGSPGSPLTAPT